MDKMGIYGMIIIIVLLVLGIIMFIFSPKKFIYEHLMIYPFPDSDLEQQYHGTDCIKDGTCRIAPNNDSFYYYPSGGEITSKLKMECEGMDKKGCGSKVEGCSNVLNGSDCYGGCYDPKKGDCRVKSSYIEVPGRGI